MKVKASTAMLIRTGIIPADQVKLLVKQGQLPQAFLQLVGEPPEVPKSDEEKEKWITDLEAKLADQEIEIIQETMLDVPETTVQVFLDSGQGDPQARVALVDTIGRLFFAVSDGEVGIGWIVRYEDPPRAQTVKDVEPIFVEDKVSFLVCTMEVME